MSEKTVLHLANELGITLEQANAVWLKVRQSIFKTLHQGDSVDLGVAYLLPQMKAPRRRHDFAAKANVMVPAQHTIKMIVPPHVQEALAGKVALSPFTFMTRSQLKSLPAREKDELARQRLDYYRLKGVTV